MRYQLSHVCVASNATGSPKSRVRSEGFRKKARGPGQFPGSLMALLAVCLLAFAGEATALTVSPTSVTLSAGDYETVNISGSRGGVQAESTNTAVATVSVSKSGKTGVILTVTGRSAGQAMILVRDKATSDVSIPVIVNGMMSVSPTSLSLTVGATGRITASDYSGSVSASTANGAIASVSVSANVVTVKGISAGGTVVSVRDSRATVNVPVTVLAWSPGPSSGSHSLLAWNDLGMHCVDGKDYSVFSILPPYNNLHAQLVNAATGKVVTSGVTLTYQAVADPTGSINTSTADKTNFWDWVQIVYGAPLAPDFGFTGNATPSLTPEPMAFDSTNGWFEASGLPIMPYDDRGNKNYYPTVRVVAKDLTGKVLASTTTVLPVSDEMTCVACHAPNSNGDARPATGWVSDPDPERAWKLNIVLLHDEKQGGSAVYQSALSAKGLQPGLYSSAVNGKPALCAGCHASNALPGTGVTGVSALTSAIHASHSSARDPQTGLRLDDIVNRNSCYMCHPGSVTKCLRGAMGNAVDARGDALMGCQDCHGSMSKVGDPGRVGWLEEPTCQACHYNGQRTTSALDGSGNLVKPADTRFATNPNVPDAGFDLYRFSVGHGGLPRSDACHLPEFARKRQPAECGFAGVCRHGPGVRRLP
jgi:hypothetical protein